MMTVKSNSYRLKELLSSAENGIKTVEQILQQQYELLEVLEKGEYKFINEDFINGVKASINQLEQRKANYEFDSQLFKEIISRIESHDNDEVNDVDLVVTLMLHIFTDIKLEEKIETNEA